MWYSPMDEMARDSARGALDKGHPQGLQHWARPRPSRAPQSRVRAEKGAVSLRIHSARLHHFLAKGMDLWSGLNDFVTSQNMLRHTTNVIRKEAHQESLIPSDWSPACRVTVPSSRTTPMESRERPRGTLRLRIIPRMKPGIIMVLMTKSPHMWMCLRNVTKLRPAKDPAMTW